MVSLAKEEKRRGSGMALLLNHENLTAVRNPAFRQYAENCLAVYDDFVRQVEQFGLPFAPEREAELRSAREKLPGCGVKINAQKQV